MLDIDFKLASLSRLEPGWNGPGSVVVSASAIDAARILANSATTPPQMIVPTPFGGVQLEWHRGGRSVEIDIDQTGTYSAFASDILRTGQAAEVNGLLDWFDGLSQQQSILTLLDLDVKLRRGWHTEKCTEGDKWFVPQMLAKCILIRGGIEAAYQDRHDVGLLIKADTFYSEHVEGNAKS